jgi:hypothetical protein
MNFIEKMDKRENVDILEKEFGKNLPKPEKPGFFREKLEAAGNAIGGEFETKEQYQVLIALRKSILSAMESERRYREGTGALIRPELDPAIKKIRETAGQNYNAMYAGDPANLQGKIEKMIEEYNELLEAYRKREKFIVGIESIQELYNYLKSHPNDLGNRESMIRYGKIIERQKAKLKELDDKSMIGSRVEPKLEPEVGSEDDKKRQQLNKEIEIAQKFIKNIQGASDSSDKNKLIADWEKAMIKAEADLAELNAKAKKN